MCFPDKMLVSGGRGGCTERVRSLRFSGPKSDIIALKM